MRASRSDSRTQKALERTLEEEEEEEDESFLLENGRQPSKENLLLLSFFSFSSSSPPVPVAKPIAEQVTGGLHDPGYP